MRCGRNLFAAFGGLLAALAVIGAAPAAAQKPGGILKLYVWDSPPSVSILDGPNPVGQRTIAPVFNNLVMFDQHVKQNSLTSIVPDLATGWTWNEEGTAVTFPLRQGIRWHDGKPFTAKDVQCTWDLLLEKSSDRSQVHCTSLAVNGLPSCHLIPWRSGNVTAVPSSFQVQPVARSGTIEVRLFCFTC